MTPISLILFDIGNVLTTNDWHLEDQVLEKAIAREFHTTVDDLERGFQAIWDKFETGVIDENEYWKILFRTAGVTQPNIANAKQIWRKYQNADHHMLNLVESLNKGYQTGILSNTSKEWLQYKVETFQLGRYVNCITDSSSTGFAKPDPRIYHLALQRHGVNPKEACFVDDKERNLLPAREVGMHTIVFTDYDDCVKSLNKIGVSVDL